MSILASEYRQEMAEPSSDVFFTGEERSILKNRNSLKISEQNETPCSKPAYIGVFFDGTNNSYRHALENKTKEESNIARLYDIFPGRCVPRILPKETDWNTDLELYERHFKIYVPGVGKAFPNIGDQTEGWIQNNWDSISGGAMATYGQGRILWGIAQLLNYIHGYYYSGIGSTILITDDEVKYVSEHVRLVHEELEREITIESNTTWTKVRWGAESLIFSLPIPGVKLLKYSTLGSDKNASLILCNWLFRLKQAIGNAPKRQDVLPLNKLHLYTFGFSRGAAQARAYLNWLLRACRIDAALHQQKAGPLSLGGIAISHDFMGIFDTVASVGFADMFAWSSGHDWWGDARSLQLPKEVGKCVHLVAAHEQRRCFPLDSVYQGQRLPDYCEEIVFPGAHSDVGGGYAPLDQGKGFTRSGEFTLSRIPLAEMYRQARLAGVPLVLEKASKSAKLSYQISPLLILEFNDYLKFFPIKEGTTGQIVTPHWEKMLQRSFRISRSDESIYTQASVNRARSIDKELRTNVAHKRLEIKKEIDAESTGYKYLTSGFETTSSYQFKEAKQREKEFNLSEDAIYSDRLDAAEKIHIISSSTMSAEYKDFQFVRNNFYQELLTDDPISIEYEDLGWLDKSLYKTFKFIENIPAEIKQRVSDDFFVLKDPEKKELRYIMDNVPQTGCLPRAVDSFIDNYIHDSVAGFIQASTLDERYWSRSFVYFRYRRVFSGSNTFYQVPYGKGFDCSREEASQQEYKKELERRQKERDLQIMQDQMASQFSWDGMMHMR